MEEKTVGNQLGENYLSHVIAPEIHPETWWGLIQPLKGQQQAGLSVHPTS